MSDLEHIRQAMATFATIIERDGPDLLPLFARLEAEAAELLETETALDRALRLARERRAA